MSQITFMLNNSATSCAAEGTALETAIKNGIPLNHSCGGMGSCGTCRVILEKGDLPPRNEVEQEMADDRGFATDERLACQLESICDDVVLRVPTSDVE